MTFYKFPFVSFHKHYIVFTFISLINNKHSIIFIRWPFILSPCAWHYFFHQSLFVTNNIVTFVRVLNANNETIMSAVHDTRSNRSQLRSWWAWLSRASFGGSKTFVIACLCTCVQLKFKALLGHDIEGLGRCLRCDILRSWRWKIFYETPLIKTKTWC